MFTPSPAPSAGPRAKPVTRTTLRGSPCGTWPLWPPRPGAARFTHTGHARWHRRGPPSSGTQEVGNQARLLGLSLGPPFHHHPCPPTKGTSSCSLGDTSLGGEPGAPGPHPGTAPYCRAREQTPSPRWASVSSSTRIWEGCGAGSRGPVRTLAFRAVTQLGDPPSKPHMVPSTSPETAEPFKAKPRRKQAAGPPVTSWGTITALSVGRVPRAHLEERVKTPTCAGARHVTWLSDDGALPRPHLQP